MPVDAGDEFSNWVFQISKEMARGLVQEARYHVRSQGRRNDQSRNVDNIHAAEESQGGTKALSDSSKFTTRDSRESVAEQYAEAFEKMGIAKPDAAQDAAWYSEFLSAYSQALNGGVSLYNLEHDSSERGKLYTAVFTGHDKESGDIITEVQMQGPNSAYEDAVAIRQKAAVAAALTMRGQDIQYEIRGLDPEDIRTTAKTIKEHQKDQLGDDSYSQFIEGSAFAKEMNGGIAANVRPCDSELMTAAVGAAAAVKLQEKASLIDLTPQELEAALDSGVLREAGREEIQQADKSPMSVRNKGIEKEPLPIELALDSLLEQRNHMEDVLKEKGDGSAQESQNLEQEAVQEQDIYHDRIGKAAGRLGIDEKELASNLDSVFEAQERVRISRSRLAAAEARKKKADSVLDAAKNGYSPDRKDSVHALNDAIQMQGRAETSVSILESELLENKKRLASALERAKALYLQDANLAEPGDREPVRAPDDTTGARGVAHDAVIVESGSGKNVTVAQVWCKASEREAILQQLKQIGAKPKENDRGEVEVAKESAQMDASSFEAAEYVTEKGRIGQEETERMPRTGREER